MGRRRLLLVFACLALAAPGSAWAAPFTKTDQKLTMSDGVQLATTLYEPATAPPVGGFPAIIMFHGLGGTRASMNAIAEQSFATQRYAVLTYDFRGHGESGGLFDLDGPRDVADVRELRSWLIARPEIDDVNLGAWGISLGGGAVWASLKAGVQFAAAEVVETWVDLYRAMAPGNLAKSGAIFQFLNSVPAERTAPEINALKQDAINSTNTAKVRAFADSRSARDALAAIRTPVYVFQGRRDFAFDIEQGLIAYNGLGGAHRLYIGDFGHPPSTFPGPDIEFTLDQGTVWFDRYLKRLGDLAATPVRLATDPFDGAPPAYFGAPPTRALKLSKYSLNRTFGARGKAVVTMSIPPFEVETFGAPRITATLQSKTKAPQLVAVLEALQPSAAPVVLSEGGLKLTGSFKKARTITFPLISDALYLHPLTKLRLTLSWTSTAQNPSNLLYVTGVPDGSSLTVKSVQVTLPVLMTAISR